MHSVKITLSFQLLAERTFEKLAKPHEK